MFCTYCGQGLPVVTDPTQRTLTCTACGREVDLALELGVEKTQAPQPPGSSAQGTAPGELIGKLLGVMR
jgi:hypothetical protein